jgi:hypothetical protein
MALKPATAASSRTARTTTLVARGGHYAALHRQWRSGAQPAPGPEAG